MNFEKVILIFCSAFALSLLHTADDLTKAEGLRLSGEYEKAERSLKRYSTPQKEYDRLKPAEKISYFRGVLELAHVRALKEDVSGSLSLLNWAEGRKEPYQRALAYVKYGRILVDMGEMERASAYLKNADEVIRQHVNPAETGAVIGQGGEAADTGAVWRDLRDDADMLKMEIESMRLKKKFGASYANYVKLRRLEILLKRARTPHYQKEANALADELMKTDPASQFAAAAGYLKGSIAASRLKEKSPKKEIKAVKDYLNEFVRRKPDGIYRGEALMLLGKISLEIEWNAKEAEKYYSQALSWFRKARERRDALSLYAGMSGELKKQVLPTRKPTSLNQWKRIVYHNEDPLRLYNTANAPGWYMDDKEKNCLLLLGFINFSQNKIDAAKRYWEQLDACVHDFSDLDRRMPNMLSRLKSAANVGYMAFTESEKKNIKSPDIRLRIQYAEFLYLQEKFDDAIKLFRQIFESSNHLETKALCMTGMGSAADIDFDKKTAAKCFKWVISRQKKLDNAPVFYSALCRYADSAAGTYQGLSSAIMMYEAYLKKYPTPSPDARYFREARYRLINALIILGETAKAKNEFRKFDQTISDGYLSELKRMFKVVEKHGRYGGGLQ